MVGVWLLWALNYMYLSIMNTNDVPYTFHLLILSCRIQQELRKVAREFHNHSSSSSHMVSF